MVGRVFSGVGYSIGAFVRGLFRGFRDECLESCPTSSFSDSQVTHAHDLAGILDGCKPLTDDITRSGKNVTCWALKNGKGEHARLLVETATGVASRPWCINAIKEACVFCSKCVPYIIFEATHNLLGCKFIT